MSHSRTDYCCMSPQFCSQHLLFITDYRYIRSGQYNITKIAFFGNFCWPTDSMLTQSLQKRAKLQPRMQFVASMRGVSYSLLLALVLSIVFLLLVQFAA